MVGDGALGAVFGTAIAAFTTGVLTAGRLLGRWGAAAALRTAAVLAAAGLALPAVLPVLPALVVGVGVVFGSAGGIGYAAAVRVAATAARPTRATGGVVGAYALGAVLAAPALDAGVAAIGWRQVLLLGACAVGGLVVAGSAVVTDPLQRARAPAPERSRDVALLWWVFAAASWPALHAFGHATAIAAERGMGDAAAAVPALAAGNLAGRLGVAAVGERLRSLQGLLVATTATMGAVTAFTVTSAGPLLLVAAVTVGGAYGATSALVPLATTAVVGPQRMAATFGVVFTGWGAAGLAAPPLTGWLADALGGHRPGLVVSTAIAVTAVPAAWLLDRRSRAASR